MTLDDLGALGDLISGLGVVFSLLYLARQVHQANHANVAAVTNAVSGFFAAQLLQVGGNRELCDVLVRQGRGEPLDEAERLQIAFVLRSQLIAFENYFNQYKLGFMDKPGWESRRAIAADVVSGSEARALWETRLAREQHPAFAQELREELARRDGASGRPSPSASTGEPG